MPSRRAALSLSSLGVALLAMLARGFLLGPPDGSQALLAASTSLLVLFALVAALAFALSDKLRGKGERAAFAASLLVALLALAYTALQISAFDAAAHS